MFGPVELVVLELADHRLQHHPRALERLSHAPLRVGPVGVGFDLVPQPLHQEQQLGGQIMLAPRRARGEIAHGGTDLGEERLATREPVGDLPVRVLERDRDFLGELVRPEAELVGGGGWVENGGAHDRSFRSTVYFSMSEVYGTGAIRPFVE